MHFPALEAFVAKTIVSTPLLRSMVLPLSNWYMNASTYRRYGLKYDDIIMEENPTMTEVLRRLPRETVNQREFRFKRAFQASLQKAVLPDEEQTKAEQDSPYLQSLLSEVRQEQVERDAFDHAERR